MSVSLLIAASTGLPEDQIRVVVATLLCVPLSYVLAEIPSAAPRRHYSTFMGLLMTLYVYGEYPMQLFGLLVMSVVVYTVVRLRQVTCALPVTAGSILALSTIHIYRLVTDYGNWRIDASAVLMIAVCKYSSFAWACQDGTKPEETLSEEQREFRLSTVPTFYEFLSYMLFLPTAVMGPSLEYRQFQDYLDRNKQYADVPDRLKRVGTTFAEAMFHLFVYLVIYLQFFPADFLATEAYQQMSWLSCLLYTWISITAIRCKYYAAWKLSSCGIDASGISYSGGAPNHPTWNLVETCNPYQVESSVHVRDKIRNWNVSVQLWLNRCIYYRFRTPDQYRTDKKAQARGQLLVFMVSSLWHGFYFGYYISFFCWWCMTQIAGSVFRIARNHPRIVEKYERTGTVGRVALWAAVSFGFTYFGSYFVVMSARSCLAVMSRLWFLPEITLIVVMMVLQRSPLLKEPRKDKKEAAKESMSVKTE